MAERIWFTAVLNGDDKQIPNVTVPYKYVECAPAFHPETWIGTKDLLAHTGVTRRTLSNWQKRGLIPSPITRRKFGRAGSFGYWPISVLGRIATLKTLSESGLTYDELKVRVG